MEKATKPTAETMDRKTLEHALSGGGFRDTLYNSGAFLRPTELSFLMKFSRKCSVFRGSIASCIVPATWPQPKTRNDVISNLSKDVLKRMRDLYRWSVETSAVGWGSLLRREGYSLFAIALALGTPASALAASALPEPDYSTIGALLLSFFGIVVLFESGFGLLFQWRLFREFFPVAGWRTPIMFIVSAVLTYNFAALDVFGRSVSAFAGEIAVTPADAGSATWLISAAILAGGSVGMMRIFEQLGIRSAPTEPVPPAIDQSKAWLSLRVTGPMKDLQTIVVKIEQAPDAAVVHAGVVGTLRNEDFWARVQRVMGRDLRRFPPSGGYLVEAGKPYKITLAYLVGQLVIGGTAKPVVCDVFSKNVDPANGPETISFAPRAIVDLTIDLPAFSPDLKSEKDLAPAAPTKTKLPAVPQLPESPSAN